MKNRISLLFAFTTLVLFSLGQNSEVKKVPEYYKFIHEVPEYLFDNVKEIHVETFDGVEQNGKIQKKGLLVNNEWKQVGSSFFNSKGQIIHQKGQLLMGDFNAVFHYENEKLKNIFWIIDETLKYVWEYSYPEKGKAKNTVYDAENETIWGVYSYDLDKNGLKMKEVLQQEGEENNVVVWKREGDGYITDKKQISNDGKTVTHMDKWIYNTKGNKSRVHRRLFKGEEADFYGATQTYEYDDKGNWIKRTSINPIHNNIFNSGNIRVTERKIVYY